MVQSGEFGNDAALPLAARSQEARARQIAELSDGSICWRGCERFSSSNALFRSATNSRGSQPWLRSRNNACGDEQACWSNCHTSRAMRRHQEDLWSRLVHVLVSMAAAETRGPKTSNRAQCGKGNRRTCETASPPPQI